MVDKRNKIDLKRQEKENKRYFAMLDPIAPERRSLFVTTLLSFFIETN